MTEAKRQAEALKDTHFTQPKEMQQAQTKALRILNKQQCRPPPLKQKGMFRKKGHEPHEGDAGHAEVDQGVVGDVGGCYRRHRAFCTCCVRTWYTTTLEAGGCRHTEGRPYLGEEYFFFWLPWVQPILPYSSSLLGVVCFHEYT